MLEDITRNDMNIYVKEDERYISIPKDIINNNTHLLGDYIKIQSSINNLKYDINRYLFDKNSTKNDTQILNDIIKLKSEEKLEDVIVYTDIDLSNIEDKLKKLCACFSISVDDINSIKDELASNYVNNSYDMGVVDKLYINEIIKHIEDSHMYSLRDRSRYGTISNEYKVKSRDEIIDLNEDEIGGQYAPILVIYRPAKYVRGEYILEDKFYVYIKRQPLNALINQERLEEKGIDSMGAIIYKKLKADLTNENLQEILAELYVYSQQNSLKFENIRLADITSNKVWMTADKLKKEFKELRYYNKNLTQKVKEIYDSANNYYTQIGGKYIFNTREFMHSYKTFKGKDISK